MGNRESSSEDNLRYGLSLSVDRDGFLRRTCPSCGRDFKTGIDRADLGSIIGPQIRRIEREIGAPLSLETDEASEESISCPYCMFESGAAEMLPEETVRYLHRQLVREVVLPKVNQMFSAFGDGSHSRSGGLVSVSFEYSRSMLPPRPIHGPEPPDMKIVEFLCCGRKAKVARQRHQLKQCLYCKTPVALV